MFGERVAAKYEERRISTLLNVVEKNANSLREELRRSRTQETKIHEKTEPTQNPLAALTKGTNTRPGRPDSRPVGWSNNVAAAPLQRRYYVVARYTSCNGGPSLAADFYLFRVHPSTTSTAPLSTTTGWPASRPAAVSTIRRGSSLAAVSESCSVKRRALLQPPQLQRRRSQRLGSSRLC